jgi:MFS family permease
MGLVPGYAQIGILAPVLIVALRFIQGVAVGGEWGGAVLMAVEHAPHGKRGFYGSWPQIGSPLGLVLATAAFSAVGALDDAAFLSWGWRVPFLLSSILIVLGLVVRLRLMESPVFAQLEASGGTARMPVKDAITGHTRAILGAAGAFIVINTVFYLVTVLGLSWATSHLGIPRGTFLGAVLVAAVIMCFTVPLFGALSDKLGRRRVFAAGAIVVALFAFPLFALIESGSTPLLFLGVIVIMGIGHPLMYGPQAALYSEMFPAKVRYSGASLGYQIGGMLGGLVPLLASALLISYDNASWPMAALLAGIAVVSLVSLLTIRARYADEAVRA